MHGIRCEALAVYGNAVILPGTGGCQNIHIYTCGDYFPQIVVCMIAADFRPAANGQQRDTAIRAEQIGESLYSMNTAVTLCRESVMGCTARDQRGICTTG